MPQERGVFQSLSVGENLTVVVRPGFWDTARVYELFPRLNERTQNKGRQLSGGAQKMLAIGHTLVTNPSLLLLDEPLEGLAPIIVEELIAAIGRMKTESGMALILVNNMPRPRLWPQTRRSYWAGDVGRGRGPARLPIFCRIRRRWIAISG